MEKEKVKNRFGRKPLRLILFSSMLFIVVSLAACGGGSGGGGTPTATVKGQVVDGPFINAPVNSTTTWIIS